MCAVLSSDSPLHFTHHIRSQGWRSVPGPTSLLLHSCCFDTGGATTCLSIIIVSPLLHLQPSNTPPYTNHHSLHILPQLRGILKLWTMFHFFTGHMFDSLMAPAKSRTCTHGASPILKSLRRIFNIGLLVVMTQCGITRFVYKMSMCAPFL